MIITYKSENEIKLMVFDTTANPSDGFKFADEFKNTHKETVNIEL